MESPSATERSLKPLVEARDAGKADKFLNKANQLFSDGQLDRDPNLLVKLRQEGNDPSIWGAAFNLLKKDSRRGDKKAMQKNLRNARILGMDEEREVAEVLDSWESVYGIQKGTKPADKGRRDILKKAALVPAGLALLGTGYALGRRHEAESRRANLTSTEASVERINDFNDLIRPIIDEAHRRRAEWAAKDPEFYNRVDRELNENLISIGLSAWAHGQGEALNVLSYNIKTGEIKSVYLTRETELPEMIAIAKKNNPSHAYAMGWGTPMALYHTGGFDTMRPALQNITGLHPDFQFYIEDIALFNFIKNVLGDSITIHVDKPLNLSDFNFDTRWKDHDSDPDKFRLEAGDHIMSAKQTMRYMLSNAEMEGMPGITHQLPERANVIKAGFNRLWTLLNSNPLDTTKTGTALISFLKEHLPNGQIATDYDLLGGVGILPTLLARLGAAKLGGAKITFPEVEGGTGLHINDELFGDGGIIRVNRFINEFHQPTEAYYKFAHPSVQRLVDQTIQAMDQMDKEGVHYDDPEKGFPVRGVLPLWAQVPILGDIDSPNLARDYYGSTRRLVKERLLPKAA